MDLFHFSHDPSIERFEPHVPVTNPGQPPLVWAIDAEHAPLYWFPRECPRVTAWPRTQEERVAFRDAFCTAAERVHAIELSWLPIAQTTVRSDRGRAFRRSGRPPRAGRHRTPCGAEPLAAP